MMDPILEAFLAYLKKMKLAPPQIPFVSNLTGDWITPAEATDRAYWARHLRQTVRFASGLQKLLKEPNRVLLEVGPGRTLSSMLNHYAEKTAGQLALCSLRHPAERASDAEFLLNSLGKLWLAGIQVDWQTFHSADRRRLPLPTYPFERKRYWIESPIRIARQIALLAETSRKDNGAGNNGGQLRGSEQPVVKLPNSGETPLLPVTRLRQTIKQPQVLASSLLQDNGGQQNLASPTFLERTVERQIQIMSEQLVQQARVLGKQLELLR
jgi:acyl transferase domain-containing protein